MKHFKEEKTKFPALILPSPGPCMSHALLFACPSSLLDRELCEARMSLTSFSGHPQ